MTGYLHALGALAVGHAPALRPRPRSLFEPGNTGSPGEEAGWPGEIDVERMAPAPRPRTRRSAIQFVPTDVDPRPVAATTPLEPMPTPAPVRLQPPVSVTEPASSAPDVSATPSPIGDRPRTGPPASRAAAPLALVEPPPPSRPTSPAAAVTSVPAPPEPARSGPVPAEPAPARERAVPAAEESRQVVVERVVREVVHASRTDNNRPARNEEAPVRPRIRPPVVPARIAAPTPQTAAPEPAPVIHVSVGRVEVRAVSPMPQPQPQPQPSRVPALALEDYLQDLGSHR